jgi:hypothetical protein
MGNESIDEMERRGFAYIEEQEWGKARQCFEEMLHRPMPTEREVKVLQNILRTFHREGRIEDAIATGDKTLKLIEGSDFGQSMQGTFVHGQVLGLVKKMRRDLARGHSTASTESSSRLRLLAGVLLIAALAYFAITKWLR